MSGKTISEQLADLKATREEKQKAMQDIAQKSIDESRSMDTAEAEAFDAAEAEIASIDADIKRLSRLEAVQKAAAKPAKPDADDAAGKTASGTPRESVQVKNTQKLEPGIAFARMARVKALAHTGQVGTRDEVQIAKMVYPHDEQLIGTLTKAAVPAASTGSVTWAGNLINEGGIAFADFVEYLRPRTLLGQVQGNLRALPFDTPVLVQGSGGSAAWVKEGSAKPLTQWTYTRTKLAPLKVAAIAAATKETLMRASAAADVLIRDELAQAIGATIDGTFVSDDAAVADQSPAGLLNGTAALTLSGGATIANIRADIKAFLTAMVTNNQTVAGTFWVMPETVAIALSLIANEVGAPAFPGIGPNGGTLVGLPVFTSQFVPSMSDGPVVALIKGSDIFLGDEGGIQVSMSDQASLEMSDAPTGTSKTPTAAQVVSMFQTNSVAFLVERFLNWAKRRSSAVAWGAVGWAG